MNNINPAHLRCRLNLDQALDTLEAEYDQCAAGSLKLLFLYGFDTDDRLVWGQAIKSNDPSSSLQFIISLTKDFVESLAQSDIYFLIKIKEFVYESSDNLGVKAFLEAHADFAGTMEMVKGFINGWQEFDLQKNADMPYLKRHMIDFINQNLGLPSLFSDAQRAVDSEIIRNNIRANTPIKALPPIKWRFINLLIGLLAKASIILITYIFALLIYILAFFSLLGKICESLVICLDDLLKKLKSWS
jgi:hypothetical protein